MKKCYFEKNVQKIKRTLSSNDGGRKELQRIRIYLMERGKIMKDRRVGMLTYKGSPKPHLSLKKYRVSF